MPKVVGTIVLGLKEVVDVLNTLPDKIANRAVKRALYSGGGVIRDNARGRVPIRTGALRKSIVVEGSKAPARNQLAVKVTIARKAFRMFEGQITVRKKKPGDRAYRVGDIYPRNYAHLVEWGTKPHALGRGSKRKYAIVGMQTGPWHPGSAPKPYLRPAFEAAREEAVRVIADRLREDIDGLGKKGKR